MKTGLYVYSCFRRNEAYFKAQLKAITDKARLAGVAIEAYSDLEILHHIDENSEFDFVLLDVFDPSLSEALTSMGIRVFHDLGALYSCYDKGLMYLKLAAYDVPCPLSYASLNPGKASLADCFEYISNELKQNKVNYPFTIRPRYDEVERPGKIVLGPHEMFKILQVDNTPFVAEERIEGDELFAYVVGDKCLAVLEKKKDKITGKSVLQKTGLDNRFTRTTAIKAATALALEFCVVHMKMKGDLALVTGVSPYVSFLEAEQVTGADIGEALFIHLKKRCKEKFYWSAEEKKRFKLLKSGQHKIDSRAPKKKPAKKK